MMKVILNNCTTLINIVARQVMIVLENASVIKNLISFFLLKIQNFQRKQFREKLIIRLI